MARLRSALFPSDLCARIFVAAAVIGVVSGFIGTNDIGWNIAGIAEGLYLAGIGVWINT